MPLDFNIHSYDKEWDIKEKKDGSVKMRKGILGSNNKKVIGMKKLKCNKCNRKLDEDKFAFATKNKKRNQRQTYCKECQSLYNKVGNEELKRIVGTPEYEKTLKTIRKRNSPLHRYEPLKEPKFQPKTEEVTVKKESDDKYKMVISMARQFIFPKAEVMRLFEKDDEYVAQVNFKTKEDLKADLDVAIDKNWTIKEISENKMLIKIEKVKE
jgi:hypothetical protein